MRLIFLDTETTGLNPYKHRIIEIAFKIYDLNTKNWIVSFSSIVAQPDDIWALADPKSLEVNGFTKDKLLEGKSEAFVADEIVELFNACDISVLPSVFVCQNPSFDRAFFQQLISTERQTALKWPYHWLDLASMFFAFSILENHCPTQKLSENMLKKNAIAKALNLAPETSPHRAMNGVEHLASCFFKLFQMN